MPGSYIFPDGYPSGPASLFATSARQPRSLVFTCEVRGMVGAYVVRNGDVFTATETNKGLWAISDIQGDEFAAITGRDLNRLAGRKLVEEEC